MLISNLRQFFNKLGWQTGRDPHAGSDRAHLTDLEGQVAAISKSQAVIEFSLDGTVLTANENFLRAMDYSLTDVCDRHHSMFVDPAFRDSVDYRLFWDKLRRGEFHAGQYQRFGRYHKSVWLQATYNPVFDETGKPYKVVKFCTDITEQKLHEADSSGQIAAINRSQAVIEFALDGTVRSANELFCAAVGYSPSEIKGMQHRQFVTDEYRRSAEYQQFWPRLAGGEFIGGQFLRIGKGGREVWIQATYNPVFDPAGRPFKVVKYAMDITPQKLAEAELETVLEQVNGMLIGLAEGDLSRSIEGEYSARFGPLQEASRTSLKKLRDMVHEIRESAELLRNSIAEISKGNQDLSARTADQAGSLEETASTMEELTSTVKQNADNAQHANRLAAEARDRADNGSKVVSTAVSAMRGINNSAKKIADIIGVIDEIAFQTNLLALNAAVEAARAGDRGRGFAVVAGEVRNLAQRSAQAAKEIKGLIKDSVASVEEGSRLVDASGTTLKEIMTAVNDVSVIIGEIAAASTQQSTGIAQTNQAITQMDHAVQRNAALVEQVAAASSSMDDQSANLAQLMRFFRGANNAADVRPAQSVHQPRSAPKQAPLAHVAPKRGARGNTPDWRDF